MDRRRAREPESAEAQHRRPTIAIGTAGWQVFCFERKCEDSSAVERGEKLRQSEERAARNEASFREANEKLGDKRLELGADGRTPFLCECSDPECTELLQLSHDEYERVRSSGNRFVVAVGHDGAIGRVVEEHDGYAVIEKSGFAGRIAEEENPRT
jgi:hypothetical protein